MACFLLWADDLATRKGQGTTDAALPRRLEGKDNSMALSPRLEVRQSQSLTLTPQLMQSIRLLQLSHLELNAFVDADLLRNPLLEREDGTEPVVTPEPAPDVTAYD